MAEASPSVANGADLEATITSAVRLYMACSGMTTQKEVAAWLGWGGDVVSRKMNGKARWHLDDVALLAEKMGVGVGDLFGDPAHLVALFRSRCFAPLTEVRHVGQMELPFEVERPQLVVAR